MNWSQIRWRYVIRVGAQSVNFSELLKQQKIYLLHNLKILTESNIWPCAHIDDWMGLKFGGVWWYEHIKECAKFKLIWKLLASTSFTMPSVWQKSLKNCWRRLARKIKLNFFMRQWFGHRRMPKRFGSNQERIGGTSFTERHIGQRWRIIIGELLLG